MTYSLLDFGDTISSNEKVASVIEYAQSAERCGFDRFWLGEHYISNTVFSNPEPLIPAIAAATDKISVGVAGILIRVHSLERIACNFSLLERLYPNRIDLGLVAPTKSSDTSVTTNTPKEIFDLLINYFKKGSSRAGVHKNSMPKLWHLTSSYKTFNSYKHSPHVNVSKALFHDSSNIETEIEEINYIRSRNALLDSKIKINIAIGCFVSYDQYQLEEIRKHYKKYSSHKVFHTLIIESPGNFTKKVRKLLSIYQSDDLTILNLGRNYKEKTACLEIISKILIFKNAQKFSKGSS